MILDPGAVTGTLDTQDSLLLGSTLNITLLTRILQFEALINRYKKMTCMELSRSCVCNWLFFSIYCFCTTSEVYILLNVSQVAGPGKAAVSIFRAH